MTATHHRTMAHLAVIEAMGPTWVYQRDGYFTFHYPRVRSGKRGVEVLDRWHEVRQDPDDFEVWILSYHEAEATSTSPEPETTETTNVDLHRDTEIRELFEKVLRVVELDPEFRGWKLL